MGRAALTFWFTITTLLGPGVCCCSFASSPHPVNPVSTGGKTVPAAKPAKPCCHQEAPPCGEQDKQNPEPGKPSKCPCEHTKQAKTLPPSGNANADFAAQLKLTDILFVGLAGTFALDLGTITPAPADASRSVVKLSGRDLLAVYSLLRC